MKKICKRILKIIRFDYAFVLSWLNYKRGREFCENIYKTNFSRNCLLQYITEPFYRGISDRHQNQRQVQIMANILSELGYNVDVLSINARHTTLAKKYHLLIDIHPGMNDRYIDSLTPDCIRIAYLTGMNPSVANKAEQLRIRSVYQRRGIMLPSERQSKYISKEIEKFDAFFYIGNKDNIYSYNEFVLPPVYYMINTCYKMNIGDLTQKEVSSFLFFASSGQIHKGLDLLLEVFCCNPEIGDLYICSNVENECAFRDEYKNELYHTPNIHTIGFVDIMSRTFVDITNKCSYVIMPSCSEGIAGSILTCMSVGLIPIVSKECGITGDDVIILPNCEMNTIENYVKKYANVEKEWITMISKKIWKETQELYTEDKFAECFSKALANVLHNKSFNR